MAVTYVPAHEQIYTCYMRHIHTHTLSWKCGQVACHTKLNSWWVNIKLLVLSPLFSMGFRSPHSDYNWWQPQLCVLRQSSNFVKTKHEKKDHSLIAIIVYSLSKPHLKMHWIKNNLKNVNNLQRWYPELINQLGGHCWKHYLLYTINTC